MSNIRRTLSRGPFLCDPSSVRSDVCRDDDWDTVTATETKTAELWEGTLSLSSSSSVPSTTFSSRRHLVSSSSSSSSSKRPNGNKNPKRCALIMHGAFVPLLLLAGTTVMCCNAVVFGFVLSNHGNNYKHNNGRGCGCCSTNVNNIGDIKVWPLSSLSSLSLVSNPLPTRMRECKTRLLSNFYSDFENFDNNNNNDEDDDEEEEEEEFTDLDDAAVMESFRARMGSLFGDVEGSDSSAFDNDYDSIIDEEYDEDDDEEEDEEEEYDEEYSEYDSEYTTTYGEDNDDVGSMSEQSSTFSSVDDLISFATSRSTMERPTTDWAIPLPVPTASSKSSDLSDVLKGGVVLLANPSKFCIDFPDITNSNNNNFNRNRRSSQPSAALLAKFGLTLPPPADLGPDRRADLLPVLVLLERHPLRGSQAVLMNRRTGYLLGDLEQQHSPLDDGSSSAPPPPPRLGAFMIQPLWFGGTSAGGSGAFESAGDPMEQQQQQGGGLDMLHQCPAVVGAKKLTDDGLYWGGDPYQAQEAMSDPSLDRVMSGFDFKFFVQSTRWLPMQLEKEVRDGTWFAASVSKEVLFKSRDRMGTRRAKPLWTEIMELMGGEYKKVRDRLYDEM